MFPKQPPFLVDFLERHLVDARLVTSAFEGSIEENFDDGDGFFLADETSWEAENVGVVVLAGQFGNVRGPTEGGTDVLVFVGCHADALTGTANGDTEG